MSIEGIRDIIKTSLETISGLTAYDNAPESINPPCAFPVPKSGSYDFTAGENYQLNFEIVLIIGRKGDIEQAQEAMDAYLAPTGSNSIKEVLEGADFGSHANSVRITGFRDYGGIDFGGISYIGCKFDAEVII